MALTLILCILVFIKYYLYKHCTDYFNNMICSLKFMCFMGMFLQRLGIPAFGSII